jgi:site-specific recombinase XerD
MKTQSPSRGPSPLTPMPSTPLELGTYVTVRPPFNKPPRKDGTRRVYFQVPAKLRPSGWPSLIPIPREGSRRGDLSDGSEVGRIQAEAKALYDELVAARSGTAPTPRRDFRACVRAYQRSDAWTTLRPKTQTTYGSYINHILLWADMAKPVPMPATVQRPDVEVLFKLFDAAPATRQKVRKQMRLLLEAAISAGWRTDNPCDGIRMRTPKSKAKIWERDDVDAYVLAAEGGGHTSIALMILLEWEIGQRLTDVRGFRLGAEYDSAAGVFRFEQSKTDSYVTVPISDKLRKLLNEGIGDQLFLFRDKATGRAFAEDRLSKVFAQVRKVAVKAGARSLLLRWLRHSCVVQLARKGVDIPGIASITGHTPAGAARVLAAYLPRDNELAWSAQAKRGLVEPR